MSSTIVYRSAIASLATQVLIGLVTSVGFFVTIPADVRDDMHVILWLEVGSRAVEFAWYAVVVCRYRTITTWTRYVDWVVSTPIMLLSTAFFFRHRTQSSLVAIFDAPPAYLMLAANWVMLGFGLAVELHSIPRFYGLAFGGLAFVGAFTSLATYIDDDALSIGLFTVVYFVWGLYGVAAGFGDVAKNVAYNVLDVFSKNFYGLFLTVYILTL